MTERHRPTVVEPIIDAYKRIVEASIKIASACKFEQLPKASAEAIYAEVLVEIEKQLTPEQLEVLTEFGRVAMSCLGQPTRDNHALLRPFGLADNQITDLLTFQGRLVMDQSRAIISTSR